MKITKTIYKKYNLNTSLVVITRNKLEGDLKLVQLL